MHPIPLRFRIGLFASLLTLATPGLSQGVVPSVTALEPLSDPLREEFLAAGEAMREQLARRAQGDEIGADRADRDLKAHRARYLALRRERLRRAAGTATPPVAATRDPFVPDGPMELVRHSVTPAEQPKAAHWDMYAARQPSAVEEDSAGTRPGPSRRLAAWGMYAPLESESRLPTPPFLVYREPGAGPSPRLIGSVAR